MAMEIQDQQFGFYCVILFWSSLCLSGCLSQSDVINQTRNGSLLNDQASDDDDYSKMGCIDWEGKPVADGEKYVPNKNDMCMLCTCDRRFPIICHSVTCSPPMDCSNVKLNSGACCDYKCLDDIDRNATDFGNKPASDDGGSPNLSLRLIASSVTSLLFFALVMFMVHRLRQRRMLLAMRRFQARSGDVCMNDDFDSERNIPDNFMSLECPPYTDPPPPYSPPKPPHILPGEQPPPYEEIGPGENRRRESRYVSGQGDRGTAQNGQSNQNENTPSSNANNVLEIRRHVNRANFQHTFLTQNPAFGVEMEMLRHPVQEQNQPSNEADILPAYASTDVVFRNATFSTMRTPPHRQFDTGDMPTHPSTQTNNDVSTMPDSRSHIPQHPSHPGMPTLTAFQRFSSLFKRDRSKWKGRTSQQRPVSECHPPHYATLSLNQNTNSQDPSNGCGPNVTYRSNSRRTRAKSCYPNLTLTDRMRLSYDSARAAYELAALSPSTSSSSSVSVEQIQEGSVPNSTTRSAVALSQAQPVAHQSQQECVYDLQQPDLMSDSVNVQSARSPVTCSSTLSPSSSGVTESTYLQSSDLQTHSFHTNSEIQNDNHANNDTTNSNVQRNVSSFLAENAQNKKYFNHNYSNIFVNSNKSGGVKNIQGACGYINNNRDHHRMQSYSNSPELHCEMSQHGSSMTAYKTGAANSNEMGMSDQSPPPPVGQMRRSHSAISQVSTFSVCSETGEKKLKDKKLESDTVSVKPLTADCHYPHHSLSQPKHTSMHSKLVNQLSSNNRNLPPIKKTTSSVVNSKDVPCVPALQPATLVVPVTSLASLPSNSVTNNSSDLGNSSVYKQDDLGNCMKKMAVDCSENYMLSSVGPLSPPFVTVQSGKLMSSSGVEWPVTGRDVKDTMMVKSNHENGGGDEKRRLRKKRDKDRKSSLSFKAKDAVGLSHVGKGEVKVKHDLCNGGGRPYPKSSSKGLSSRRYDKKRIQVLPQLCPTADNPMPVFDDISVPYGNADVYRSQGCEMSFTSSPYPVLSSPFHKYVDTDNGQDTKCNYKMSSSTPNKNTTEGVVGSNNYNSPMRHLHQSTPNKDSGPPYRKRSSNHKRQTSAGNRNTHHCPSVSQSHKHHIRSKSLTDKVPSSKQRDIIDPLSKNDTAFDQVASGGKWVKSGFGHDLAFEDQLGDIDLGIVVNASPHRLSGGYCLNPNPLSKPIRVEHPTCNTDPQYGTECKQETNAVVVPLPNRRRSGLSQDLSFVNRSEITQPKRLNKRGSLPAFLTFSNPPSKTYNDANGDYENSFVESQPVSKQPRNSREKRDQPDSSERNGKLATSYV